MNQQKIGLFIAKLRKEKGMTQQELAKKIGVTDKAISKWENGRCLMDISMLKPLSECLDITIVEIINGERIENETIGTKTDETLEKALDYTNNKIKKIKNKIIKISIFVFLLIIIVSGTILYKELLASYIYSYVNYEMPEEIYKKIHNYMLYETELTLVNEFEIKTKKLPDDKYLKVNNIKIENNLKNYKREDYESIVYFSFEGNNEIAPHLITFSEYDSNEFDYIKKFKNFSFECSDIYLNDFTIIGNLNLDDINLCKYINTNISNKDKEEFLRKNNINNDIDFLKFIGKNYKHYLEKEYNMNYRYKTKEMKEIYMFNNFVRLYFLDLEKAYLITGDHNGYTLVRHGFSDEAAWVVENYIFKDGKRYWINYVTNDYQDTTFEYIKNLLSTLVIK